MPFCGECGTRYEAGARFCEACGNRLEEGGPTARWSSGQESVFPWQAIGIGGGVLLVILTVALVISRLGPGPPSTGLPPDKTLSAEGEKRKTAEKRHKAAKGSSAYVGRWECSAGRGNLPAIGAGGGFLEIKADNGTFLVTDRTGATYPGSLNDQGILVVSGVPLVGSMPLPIYSDTGELICSACGCDRYRKVR